MLVIVEVIVFGGGIVIVQVNEIVDSFFCVDIFVDWVNFVVQVLKLNYIELLFICDLVQIFEIQVLMVMMVIKGIYVEYGVNCLNYGIGFDIVVIELLFFIYVELFGLKEKICQYWVLNFYLVLILVIELGFVRLVYLFGLELGMEKYIVV